MPSWRRVWQKPQSFWTTSDIKKSFAQRRKGRKENQEGNYSWRCLRLCAKLLFLQAVDQACNAVLYQAHVKVYQQTQAFIGQAKVGDKLLLVDRSDGFN